MKYRFISILLPILIVQNSFGQVSSDSICWTENVKLEWSDFQGKPDTTKSWKAASAPAIHFNSSWDRGLPNYSISNCFHKKLSWTKDTSTFLLKHEQLHFDIAELHVRKMRKSVDSLRLEGVNNINTYSLIIKYWLKRRNLVDSLYDRETLHSVLNEKQVKWNVKVREELDDLNDYSSN